MKTETNEKSETTEAPETTVKTEPTEKPATKKNKTALVIVLCVVAVLVVAACVVAAVIWQRSKNPTDDMFQPSEPTAQTADGNGGTEEKADGSAQQDADWIDADGNAYNFRDDLITMLLIGVDYTDEAVADEAEATPTDEAPTGNAGVLALAVLDPESSEVTLLYIPNSTMAYISTLDEDGNYLDTVNAPISNAFAYGTSAEQNCELTVEAVSNLLYGIPIVNYAAVDYAAVASANELMDGIEITFDGDYSDIDSAFALGESLKLTSEQAKEFVTYGDETDPDSAYERGVRQIAFIGSMFQQCKTLFEADSTFAVQLLTQVSDYITTDLSVSEIAYLARQAFGADFDANAAIMLEGEMTADDQGVEYQPDEQWIHDFVADTFCEPVAEN